MIAREQVLEVYKSQLYNYFYVDVEVKKNIVVHKIYYRNRTEVLVGNSISYKIDGRRRLNLKKTIDKFYIDIPSDIQTRLEDMIIDYLLSESKFKRIIKFRIELPEFKERLSKYKSEKLNEILDVLDGIFVNFDDDFDIQTNFDVKFPKIDRWENSSGITFSDRINFERESKEIIINFFLKIQNFRNDSNKTLIENKISEINYYSNIKINFLEKIEMFCSVTKSKTLKIEESYSRYHFNYTISFRQS